MNLESIFLELRDLKLKVATLDDEVKYLKTRYVVNVKLTTIDLPDHWRKTYETLEKLGDWSEATTISNITLRARAVESQYLNAMARMNILLKKRSRRKTVFIIPSKVNNQ